MSAFDESVLDPRLRENTNGAAQQHLSPPGTDMSEVVAMLKRRVIELEAEADEHESKRRKDDIANAGRVILRLVDLFTPIDTLISALDSHAQLKQQVRENVPGAEAKWRMYNRNVNSGKILMSKVPQLKELMSVPTSEGQVALKKYIKKVATGARGARSDDFGMIRDHLVLWIDEEFDLGSKDKLSSGQRENRGLANDVIGKLLCPFNLDWDNDQVRANIRSGATPIFDDFYPRVLYYGLNGPPVGGTLLVGYLKSRLLVKTYMAIFTSPSSPGELGEDQGIDKPIGRSPKLASQNKSTRAGNASLMEMDGKVTPRSIAYTVVMLLFNLTAATRWSKKHNGINYHEFFNFIVDYFEKPTSEAAIEDNKALLKWWNDTIFPDYSSATSDGSSEKSRARLDAARADKENWGA